MPDSELARADEPRLLEAVRAQHDEAVALGITGVPAVRRADQKVFVSGALPFETYRRWVNKLLSE